jgi:flagellar hook-basal body complex protein FliE
VISSNISGAAAYAAIARGADPTGDAAAATGDSSFSNVLQGAISGLTELGRDADTKSVQAMTGTGNLTDVVMAVSKVEMALQASVAVRDKVISAYQDIMKMAV